MVSAKRLTGINPLSYMGVEPYTPAPLFVKSVAPTANDVQNFNIGTLWLVTGHNISEEVWMLVSQEAGVATWVQLYPGGAGGGANEFPTDSGIANQAGGILNIFGDGSFITTSGAGNTVTITFDSSPFATTYDTDAGAATPAGGILVVHGGTNIGTTGAGNVVTINLDPSINLAGSLTVGTTSLFTGNAEFAAGVRATTFGLGVVQSDISGNLFSSNGTDGQVIIAATGLAPAWANITSLDSSVTITNGPNSIDLSATGGGGGGATNFPTDAGTATEVGGVLNVRGGTNINTTGSGNTVRVNLDNSVTLSGSMSVGTTLTVDGGSLFNGNAQFDANVTVNNFNAGVVQSDSGGLLFSTKGTDGQVLIGSSIGAPAWANITAGPNIVITNGHNEITIASTGGGGGGTNCAFLAHQATTATVPGNSYNLGDAVVLTTDFDVGGNFFPGNGAGGSATFTAPTTGKYFLQLTAQWNRQPLSSTTLFGQTLIVTPSRTYRGASVDFSGSSPNSRDITATTAVCADLTVGDVVTFVVDLQTGPGRVIGVASPITTYCSGFLVGSGGIIGAPTAFMAYQGANTPAIASGTYLLGSQVALTVGFDDGANFFAGNGAGAPATFTAPINGRYNLQLAATFQATLGTIPSAEVGIITPAFTYQMGTPVTSGTSLQSVIVSTCAPLTAGDVVTFEADAFFNYRVNGSASPLITFCSGSLVK